MAFDFNAFFNQPLGTANTAGTSYPRFAPSPINVPGQQPMGFGTAPGDYAAASVPVGTPLQSGGAIGAPAGDAYGPPAVAAAAAAAKEAAVKGTTPVDMSYDVGNQGRGPMFPTRVAPPVQSTPYPDKAAGEAAMRAGGAPRVGIYGDTPITMSGNAPGTGWLGTKGSFNSFSGTGGQGGQGGQGGGSNPLMDAYDHINTTMNQAKQLRSTGDLFDAIQAKGLEGHASRMKDIFTALSSHGYQQGMLGAEAERLKQSGEAAAPTNYMNSAEAKAMKDAQGTGDFSKVLEMQKARMGGSMYTPTGMMGNVLNAGSGGTTAFGPGFGDASAAGKKARDDMNNAPR